MTTDPSEDLARIINSHGFGFQAAVLYHCTLTVPGGYGSSLKWKLLVDEVPTELGAREFHIDGVLQLSGEAAYGHAQFVVVECKRTDPAYGEWVFMRSSPEAVRCVSDVYYWDEPNKWLVARAARIPVDSHTAFDRAFERKLRDKGTGIGRGWDDALAQALRGAGGFASTMYQQWLPKKQSAAVVPMIITTADLVTVAEPLDTAELSGGNIPSPTREEKQWLWFSYNANRSLMPVAKRPHNSLDSTFNRLARYVQLEHSRAVLVVNWKGIPDAMQMLAHKTMDLKDYIV